MSGGTFVSTFVVTGPISSGSLEMTVFSVAVLREAASPWAGEDELQEGSLKCVGGPVVDKAELGFITWLAMAPISCLVERSSNLWSTDPDSGCRVLLDLGKRSVKSVSKST